MSSLAKRSVLQIALLLLGLLLFVPSARADYAQIDSTRESKPLSSKALQRIVGGRPVNISSYPWQVSLVVHSSLLLGASAKERHLCGGSLLAPQIVITAAHCVYDYGSSGFLAPNTFAVVSGRSKLSGAEGQEIDVGILYYFISNSGEVLFNPITFAWDMALLKLSEPVSAQPIKIAGAGEEALWDAGSPALVSGWGKLHFGDETTPDNLRAVNISMLRNSDCSLYDDYFTPTQLCAGTRSGGKDSCQGDSGGPLVVPTRERTYRLVGAVSYGNGCGERLFPGVYTRLAGSAIKEELQLFASSEGLDDFYGSGATAPPAVLPRWVKRPKVSQGKVFFSFTGNGDYSYLCIIRKGRRIIHKQQCRSSFRAKVGKGRYRATVQATDWFGASGAISAPFVSK